MFIDQFEAEVKVKYEAEEGGEHCSSEILNKCVTGKDNNCYRIYPYGRS